MVATDDSPSKASEKMTIPSTPPSTELSRFEAGVTSPSTILEGLIRRTLRRAEGSLIRQKVRKFIEQARLPLYSVAQLSSASPGQGQIVARSDLDFVIARLARSIRVLNDLGYTITIRPEQLQLTLGEIVWKIREECRSILWLANICELLALSITRGFDIVSTPAQSVRRYFAIHGDVVETDDGSKFYLESIDPWVLTETFILGIHDLESGAFTTMLDIGAAFGDSAIRFARRGKKVVAVEPANFRFLRANLALNGLEPDRVLPLNLALGAEGRMELTTEIEVFDGNASAFIPRRGNVRNVPSFPLSKILGLTRFQDVDYLKMDCKGCESTLTIEDLANVRKLVKIDYWSIGQEGLSKVVLLLQRAGFYCQAYHYDPVDKGRLPMSGTLLGVRTSPTA